MNAKKLTQQRSVLWLVRGRADATFGEKIRVKAFAKD